MASGELLTRVDIQFLPEFLNYWLRFGEPRLWQDRDRRRAFAYFGARQTFAYVRWEAGEYGTRHWRLLVLRAGAAAVSLHRVPGVTPGADILLDLAGAARVKRAFAVIDAVEALGIDPAEVAPAHWVYVQNRLLGGLPVRPYGPREHRAWLAQRRLSRC